MRDADETPDVFSVSFSHGHTSQMWPEIGARGTELDKVKVGGPLATLTGMSELAPDRCTLLACGTPASKRDYGLSTGKARVGPGAQGMEANRLHGTYADA